MNWSVILFVVVYLAAAFFLVGSALLIVRIVRGRRRGGSASSNSSASPPRNTTLYLNTREELAQFVSDLQKRENDWRWIMTTPVASLEVCFVSFVISGSSEHALQVCLSRRLLTSLTLQELQCLENELRRAGRERSVLGEGE